ncbi:hypothetical protein WA158_001519 [Blastocystis sp. Blastoise]
METVEQDSVLFISENLDKQWTPDETGFEKEEVDSNIQFFVDEFKEKPLSLYQRILSYLGGRSKTVLPSGKTSYQTDWRPSIAPDYESLVILTKDNIHFLSNSDHFEEDIVLPLPCISPHYQYYSWSSNSILFATLDLQNGLHLYTYEGKCIYTSDQHFWQNQEYDQLTTLTFTSYKDNLYSLMILNSKGKATLYDILYDDENEKLIDVKLSIHNPYNHKGAIYFMDVNSYLLPPYRMAYSQGYLGIAGSCYPDTTAVSTSTTPASLPINKEGIIVYSITEDNRDSKLIFARDNEGQSIKQQEYTFFSLFKSYISSLFTSLSTQYACSFLSFSPSATSLLLLSTKGSIEIFNMKDGTLLNKQITTEIITKEQEDFYSPTPSMTPPTPETQSGSPVPPVSIKASDIYSVQWWNDSHICVCTYNGLFFIYDIIHNINKQGLTSLRLEKGSIIYGNQTEKKYALECSRTIFKMKDKLMRNKIERNYGITSIYQVTPEELYAYYIKNGEYKPAYTLATTYQLNLDDIYKARWCQLFSESSTPSLPRSSIDDFLGKVKDSQYIITECLTRYCQAEDVYIFIIKYGLKICSDLLKQENIIDEIDGEQTEVTRTLINNVDHIRGNRSIEILLIYKYLFKMKLMKLDLYRQIRREEKRGLLFNIQEYIDIEKKNIKELALSYAQKGNLNSLKILFHMCQHVILPYRFEILNSIPEIYDPKEYEYLFPQLPDIKSRYEDIYMYKEAGAVTLINLINETALSNYGNIYILKYLQEQISVYHFPECVSSLIHTFSSQSDPFIYALTTTKTIPPKHMNIDTFVSWFQSRAIEIDNECGYLLNCVSLFNIAKERCTSSDFEKLAPFARDTELLYTLTYKEKGYINITLDEWNKKSETEKIETIMGNLTPETFEAAYISQLTAGITVYIPVFSFMDYFQEKCLHSQDGIEYINILIDLYIQFCTLKSSINPFKNVTLSSILEYFYKCLLSCPYTEQYHYVQNNLNRLLNTSAIYLNKKNYMEEKTNLSILNSRLQSSILLSTYSISYSIQQLTSIYTEERDNIINHIYILTQNNNNSKTRNNKPALDFPRISELKSVSLLEYLAKETNKMEGGEYKWKQLQTDMEQIREGCFAYLPPSCSYYVLLPYILDNNMNTSLTEYSQYIDDTYMTNAVCVNIQDRVNSLNCVSESDIDIFLAQLGYCQDKSTTLYNQEINFLEVFKSLLTYFPSLLPFQLRQAIQTHSILYCLASFSTKLYALGEGNYPSAAYISEIFTRLELPKTQLFLAKVYMAESAYLQNEILIASSILMQLINLFPAVIPESEIDYPPKTLGYNDMNPLTKIYLPNPTLSIYDRLAELSLQILRIPKGDILLPLPAKQTLTAYALRTCPSKYIKSFIDIYKQISIEQKSNSLDTLKSSIIIPAEKEENKQEDSKSDETNNETQLITKYIKYYKENTIPKWNTIIEFDDITVEDLQYMQEDYSNLSCPPFLALHLTSSIYLSSLYTLSIPIGQYTAEMEELSNQFNNSTLSIYLLKNYLLHLYYYQSHKSLSSIYTLSPLSLYALLENKEQVSGYINKLYKYYVVSYLQQTYPSISSNDFVSNASYARAQLNTILKDIVPEMRQRISNFSSLFDMNKYTIYMERFLSLLFSSSSMSDILENIDKDIYPNIIPNGTEKEKEVVYTQLCQEIYRNIHGDDYKTMNCFFYLLRKVCPASTSSVYSFYSSIISSLLSIPSAKYNFKHIIQKENALDCDIINLNEEQIIDIFYPQNEKTYESCLPLFELLHVSSSLSNYIYILSSFYQTSSNIPFINIYTSQSESFKALSIDHYYKLVLYIYKMNPLGHLYDSDNTMFRCELITPLYDSLKASLKAIPAGKDEEMKQLRESQYKDIFMIKTMQIFSESLQPCFSSSPSLYSKDEINIEQMAFADTNELIHIINSLLYKNINISIIVNFITSIQKYHSINLFNMYSDVIATCISALDSQWSANHIHQSINTVEIQSESSYPPTTFEASIQCLYTILRSIYSTTTTITPAATSLKNQLLQFIVYKCVYNPFKQLFMDVYNKKEGIVFQKDPQEIVTSSNGSFITLSKLILYMNIDLSNEALNALYTTLLCYILLCSDLLTENIYTYIQSNEYLLSPLNDIFIYNEIMKTNDTQKAPFIRLLLEVRQELYSHDHFFISESDLFSFIFTIIPITIYNEEQNLYNNIMERLNEHITRQTCVSLPKPAPLSDLYFSFYKYICQNHSWSILFTIRYLPSWYVSEEQDKEILKSIQGDAIVQYIYANTSIFKSIYKSVSLDVLKKTDFSSLDCLHIHLLLLVPQPGMMSNSTLFNTFISFTTQYTKYNIMNHQKNILQKQISSSLFPLTIPAIHSTLYSTINKNDDIYCQNEFLSVYSSIYRFPPFLYSIHILLSTLILMKQYDRAVLLYFNMFNTTGDLISGLKSISIYLHKQINSITKNSQLKNGWNYCPSLLDKASSDIDQLFE